MRGALPGMRGGTPDRHAQGTDPNTGAVVALYRWPRNIAVDPCRGPAACRLSGVNSRRFLSHTVDLYRDGRRHLHSSGLLSRVFRLTSAPSQAELRRRRLGNRSPQRDPVFPSWPQSDVFGRHGCRSPCVPRAEGPRGPCHRRDHLRCAPGPVWMRDSVACGHGAEPRATVSVLLVPRPRSVTS